MTVGIKKNDITIPPENDPYFINLLKIYNVLPGSLSWKDINGHYIWHNQSFLNDLGISESILGKTDSELWPEDSLSIIENDKIVFSSNKTHHFEETFSIDNKKTHFITTKSPLKNINGQIIGIVVNLIPLNNIENYHTFSAEEIKQFEKNSTISDHYLRNIIESVPGSIYWKNKEGVWIGCNNYTFKTTGISAENLLGKTDYELWPEYAKELRENDLKVMHTGCTLSKEESVILPNGEIRYYAAEKMPLRDLDGNIIGVIGNSIDITELKETQEKLEKAKEEADAANIAKTVFIANISHDIRTPLSGVIGLSNIIEHAEKDPKLKIHAHHIAQSADELLNMLNQVISAVSSGKLTVDDVHSEPFDLKHLIESLINLESPPAYLNHIQLETHIDDQIPNLLVGDHDKIYHIILNLVGNALKFTQKGHIRINITLAKKLSGSVQLLFEVSDTGMGIPPESLDRIFEMFYKVTPSYKGRDKGHGMGLYIVKAYTELLGGQVSVESKPNEGSKFSFTLTLNIAEKNAMPKNIVLPQSVFSSDKSAEPIQQTDVFKISSLSKEKVPENPQNTPEILAIEDNKVMLSLVETLIKEAKCNPTKAEDGESGLELAKTKHFDLIFSDVGLPGISGIEFAQKLRQYEKDHNKKPVPIVAVTGHGQAIERECLEAGINYVIIKPLRPETLTELCNKFALFGGAQSNPSHLDKSSLKSINTQNVGALGPDLPNTEAKLFEIDNLPIFDIENAGRLLGDNTALLMKMLRDNINIVIPEELPRLKKAHDDCDWPAVADIAHKMKSGFLSISLTRLATACQYLERYQQAGHSASLEKLYQQFLKILEITIEQLKPWSE